MFSPWIFKKKIFGADVVIEFDLIEPIFKILQKNYLNKIKWYWDNREKDSQFVVDALYYLPQRSFVIFFFDKDKELFVQFAKFGDDVLTVFPVWNTNVYADKRKELTKLIKKAGIDKKDVRRSGAGEDRIDVSVRFHCDNVRASEFTFLIVRELFDVKNPKLYSYESHRLVEKQK